MGVVNLNLKSEVGYTEIKKRCRNDAFFSNIYI